MQEAVVSNTDRAWFDHFRPTDALTIVDEVNFWRPLAQQRFRKLAIGGPLFFRLKSPHSAIAGFGFFAGEYSLSVNAAFLQIAKQLRSGDILLLKACWNQYSKNFDYLRHQLHDNARSKPQWLYFMSQQMSLPEGLIDVHADRLLELRLFRAGGPPPDQIQPEHCRLSLFGQELCRHITKY